jgi:3-oxoacyl-[acyl-carrier-protein] synthase-1
MSAVLALVNTGLVTSVGLSAPASCAAIRAKVTNPTQTRFIDSGGEWIIAHEVGLDKPWRGRPKLARMAAMAIEEALADVPRDDWSAIPLLLCVAEHSRPGRTEGLDDRLFHDIEHALGARFAAGSAIVAEGRVAVPMAVARARALVQERRCPRVLVVATDSLLNWPTLSFYERSGRLLTPGNSNGFIPGEGAGALLLAVPDDGVHLTLTGVGFGAEKAHVDSGEPLRAEGLKAAILAALAEANRTMHDMDLRIVDISGEHYYFKETALALSRTLRRRKEAFDLWHPSECIGESGATAGAMLLALADMACRKGFSPGPRILAHMANDDGRRAALSLEYGGRP